MDAPTDRVLVLGARRGEVEAYGELVRRYQTSVFNVCYRLLGERREAEDLTQEAFIRAHARLAAFDTGRPFGPWIRRVAANLCLNHLERVTPASVSLNDELDLPVESAELDLETGRERAEQADAVRAALYSLPPHYRAVVELRHFQELSYAEIAQALDLPISDVKSHLFRARQLLAKKLATDMSD
jgi:RNA polymerase sigma-70 factor (ECF subfamily)